MGTVKKQKEGKRGKRPVRFSITSKILTMSIGCILIAMLASQIILSSISSNELVDNGRRNLSTLAHAKGQAFDQYIASQKALTQSVANNGQVIAACKEYVYTNTTNQDTQESLSEYQIGRAHV